MSKFPAAQFRSLLDEAIPAAVEAGEAIQCVAADIGAVTTKEDGSPLTRADLAAHSIIESRLSALTPDWPVISEEGDLTDVDTSTGDCYWLVDPLDGTKEFVKQNGEYTVNIALVSDCRPILGVVNVPALGALYYAVQGQGAWKRTSGEPVLLEGGGSAQPLTAVISRSHPSAATDAFLDRLGVRHVIERGSSVKICAVAEGQVDVYPRPNPTCLWDTAAGVAIAREAGCRVEDLNGEELLHNWAKGATHDGFVVYAPETCRPFPP